MLAAISNQSVAEGAPLTVTASATDADLPAETLTYSLVTAPIGATLNPTTGVFTWTPSEGDGPGTFPVTIRVTDSGKATDGDELHDHRHRGQRRAGARRDQQSVRGRRRVAAVPAARPTPICRRRR